MIIERLKEDINSGKTVVGIGPMSKNIVNAAIEISDDYDIPVVLIASRRQIDSSNIQRGYVNNWSTDEFSNYVRKMQRKNNIILARDHGGPWQNNIETYKRLSIKDAMKSAKESYMSDMDSGFNIIHIDPSIDIFNQLSFNEVFERLSELYLFCSDYASKNKMTIEFEVGTEEQMINSSSFEEFQNMLNKIDYFCNKNKVKKPMFVVSQIGTKVMEMRNIGLLNQFNNAKLKSEIGEICSFARNNGVFVKVHNCDYLRKNIINEFPLLGINAVNIAPEFGVYESKKFLKLLEKYHLHSLSNEFLELSYNSRKWDKWVFIDSKISKKDKAIIAGHYVFSLNKFEKIKELAQKKIFDFEIDTYLKNELKNFILNYIINLGYKNLKEVQIASVD